ncbi:radical SAM protein [candidate division KSB3 bacterium]|uniref:Radical SAM protein n=1 Tax=candidate division KSB3 bacterium TaxID=2044937 RepID=A0A9D5JYN5_9BACT|nr:radical SAM protein [candidate division KSB3 bacterium]MBD3326590.1 radical SAM protein [candidate division KSB3 bacterium]
MRKIIPIFVPHQGCPRRCIFCHQPHITGIPLHASVTPETVRKTIDTALQEPKSRAKQARFEVAFYGGSFTGLAVTLQARLLRAVQAYVDSGDLTGIRLSSHPGLFDDAIFALLNAFSVTTVELGVQSFDDKVLRLAGRGHTAEEAVQTIGRLQRLSIDVGLHLMIGLPGDSHAKSLDSARKAVALQPTSVRIHPTLVLRDTPLETMYRAGQYTPLSLNAAVTTCKDLVKLFRAHHIPVIRIGLQPTPAMGRTIAAGPFHPALRQLVDAELMADQMAELYRHHVFPGKYMTVLVAPQDVSTVRGQKNRNLTRLQQQFDLRDIQIVPDASLPRGEIALGSPAQPPHRP